MAQEKFIIEIRTKGFTRASKSLKKVTNQTRSFSREANKGSSVAATFRRQMSGLRNNLLLVGFAFGTVALAFKKFIDASTGFQDVKARLVGLMGSAERAERAFKNFNKVAATTPFMLDDVVNAGAQLQAFGVNAEETLRSVTDLAAYMQTSATEAANALGRAYAGGAGAADILREKGILNIIKTSQGLDDLSKTSLPQFREAFIATLIDPAAGIEGSANRMSLTFTGAFSNMMDSVTRLAAEIGDTFLPGLTSMVVSLGESATSVRQFIKYAKEGHAEWNAFGVSVKQLSANAETMSLSTINSELMGLKKELEFAEQALVKQTEAYDAVDMKIIGVVKEQRILDDGVISLTESTGALTDIMKTEGVTVLGLGKNFTLFDEIQQDGLKTQLTMGVSTDYLTEKIKILNDEIARREAINPGLESAQITFKELLEKTVTAQIKHIDATIAEIETNALLLGSATEVAEVLENLKKARDDLIGQTELEVTQSTFNDLLEKTVAAQIKNIDATILEIETNALLIGSTQEVNAVLAMLKKKRDDLSGKTDADDAEQKRVQDMVALELRLITASEEEKRRIRLMAAKEIADMEEEFSDAAKEAQEKTLKTIEDNALSAAAAITTLASGIQAMTSEGASSEDKMKALLRMLGQLAMIAIPGGSGSLIGAGISAMSGFVGHTGGLIQNNGIQRFASGGMVQGQDNVPIMAQSGEFIMQRSAVSNIGLQNLAQMNQGGQSSGGLTINIAGDMVGDEDHVRTKVLPAIKEELRREANA